MPDPPDGQPEPTRERLDDAIDPALESTVPAVDAGIPEVAAPIEAQPPAYRRAPAEASWLRMVIVVWCFWLLGAWAAAWLSDTSVPRVRWMMFAGSIGLMLAWPAFRLSEQARADEPGQGGLTVLLDWLAMIGVYQAVIWSLHLVANWPLVRGLWLDAAVASWSLLTALIVAAARRWPNGFARLVGMALCLALVFAEPIALWLAVLSGGQAWPMYVSPIQAFWELTQPPDQGTISPWDRRALMIAVVAVMGWVALGLWCVGERVATRRAATS